MFVAESGDSRTMASCKNSRLYYRADIHGARCQQLSREFASSEGQCNNKGEYAMVSCVCMTSCARDWRVYYSECEKRKVVGQKNCLKIGIVAGLL